MSQGRYVATAPALADGGGYDLRLDSSGRLIITGDSSSNFVIAAGESHIGQVAGYAFDVAVTPTVSAGAYSAGDIVGALMTFTVARANDEIVVLKSILVSVKAAVTSSLTAVILNADPTSTTKTDNAAYSLNAADTFKVRAAIPLNAVGAVFTDHGTPNTYQFANIDIPIKPASGTKDIYVLLIDGTGWTLTSTSDIQVTLAGRGA